MPIRSFSTIFLCLLATVAAIAAPALAADGKLRGELPRVLEESAAEELIPVSIVLADQLTGAALAAEAAGLDEAAARRQALVRALKAHAARTQAPLRARLEAAAAAGRAARIRPLWIGNIVAADLTAGEIRAVAARPEVSHVNWAPPRAVFLDPPVSATPPRPPLAEQLLAPFAPAGIDAEVECGVELMRAPEVWDDLGNTGEGSIIAVIDSGVCWYHSDIENQIWVNPGEDLDGDGVVMDDDDRNGIDDDGNGYIDDLIGYDIDNGDDDPNDDNSHGSHCAGTVAGDGTGGFQAGMAPDAQIMVLRVGLATSDEPDVWEAMEYAAENGASAITMSLGWKHSWDPDRETWRVNCENTIEMGTAMVIAAGNEGSGNEPDNVRTPGDVPRVITVGAVNCSDEAAGFSSRGPVTWEDVPPWNDHPYPPGLIKPDVAGPGVDTRSHNKCSGYSYKSGTSMATPHVAGAVALMLSANPGLTHDDLKLLLEDTAVELGDPGKDNVYGSGRVDAYEAVLQSATSDGRISIKERTVSCQSMLHITVSDADLKGLGTLEIDIHSDTETDPESVSLAETSPTSGVFKGEIPTDGGPVARDGLLQVSHADLITAVYIDEDDGEGGTNVEKTDTATADCREPLISDVDAVDISDTYARIVWQTDEASGSVVRYGQVVPPTAEERDAKLVTDHSIPLEGLEECTIYKYEVESSDPHGNTAIDDNGGAWYTFETYGNFPDVGIIPCHQGQVTLDDDDYGCDDEVVVTVTDIDLNADPGVIEQLEVLVTSTSEPDGEWITVTELDVDNSRFRGTIQLDTGPAMPGDALLAIAADDLITAHYYDEDDGEGNARTDTDTSYADCIPPAISDVRVVDVSATRAAIEWTTDEPATTRLEWGTTPDLGEVVENLELTTSHRVVLSGFEACDQIHFRIFGADRHDDGSVSDAGGLPYAFNLNQVGGLLFHDNFETDTGWQLNGEWERGAPQQLGSSQQDPSAPWSGDAVLGEDLSGQGSFLGDYEPEAEENAVSPTLDATGHSHLELIYRRKLGVRSGDSASVSIFTAGASKVWGNSSTVADSNWIEMRHDISEYADNRPAVQIVFQMDADESGQSFGWNIDELIVKDARQPDYVACENCAGAPTFGGVTGVSDPEPCATGGLRVEWQAAPAWGTGDGGTYEVHRDTDPDFLPEPGNRVAAGLTGTSWTDSDAPVDTQVWYIVRARNNESCGDGGLVDGNLVRLPGTETVEQPEPGSPGNTLAVELVGEAHVRLSWAPAAGADHYVVRRSESTDFSDPIDLGSTTDTFLEDENAARNAKLYLYRVVAANACGSETP